MAESTSPTEPGELSCSVCLEGFQEPKVLPCCHSFCLKCLEKTFERAKDKNKITCPQCRTQHQVPSNGLNGFLTDYTLLDWERTSQKPTEQSCEQCEDGGRGVAYCKTCSDYLCDECLQGHRKYKPLRNHDTISLSGDMDELVLDGPGSNKKKSYLCSVHPNESLKLFCKTCQTLACIHCFITSHNGHDIGSMDTKRTRELQKRIRELVREASLKLREFEENLKYIKFVEQEKKEDLAPIKSEINKKIDFIIAQLETRRKQLLEDAEDSQAKDLKELWAERDYHETAIAHLRGALDFAKRSLKVKEDIQLFAVSVQVKSSLKQLCQLQWNSQPTEMIEMTSIRFGSTDLNQLHLPVVDFRALGEVHRTMSLPEIEIMSKDIPSTIRVGNQVQLHVKASLTLYGRDMLLRSYGDLHLTALGTVQRKDRVEKIQVQVFKDSEDLWTIQFTPHHRGTYSICIEAHAAYGVQVVNNKYRCNIFAQR